MVAPERFAIAAFLTLALAGAPVRADDAAHPMHADAAHPAHTEAVHPAHPEPSTPASTRKSAGPRPKAAGSFGLSTAMRAAKHRMPGTVVRARLCHGHDGLVYVLTVLAHDGKVAQIAVDAVKGTFAGDR